MSILPLPLQTSNNRITIGGDFALDWNGLCETNTDRSLFATGRAALAAILINESSCVGDWLVPDYICPVVPQTLSEGGARPKPYHWHTPWMPDLSQLDRLLDNAAGIIIPFYMGLAPASQLWELLSNRSLVVIEDRCQCVGSFPAPNDLQGSYAIGSFRKWMPTPDGAYCVKRDGAAPLPIGSPDTKLVLARMAAALVKQTRSLDLPLGVDRDVEQAYIELFRLGETWSEFPVKPKPASSVAGYLIRNANFDMICARRIANQTWLAKHLAAKDEVRILEPEPGLLEKQNVPLLAMPVTCSNREAIRRRLASQNIYCPMHWVDGDWTGLGGVAADLAESVLSIPIDQRYELEDLQRIVEVLE